MDQTKAMIVILVTVGVVVLINVAIYYWLTRKNAQGDQPPGQIELLLKAAGRARDPWKTENDNLAELSRRVKELNEDSRPSKET